MKQTHKPKISVVIPCFNEEKYIGKCLASLKSQTFKDFEIIVVDNNCTDKTAEIARSFGAKVVKEPVQGMIPARDRGFSEASAPFIARTDADSRVPHNWLSRIYSVFRLHPDVVAITGGFYFLNKSKLQNTFLFNLFNSYTINLKLLMGHYPLNGPNYALRKDAWMKVHAHKNDKVIHEDVDLSCHLAEIGIIRYQKDLRVYYSLRRWKKKLWHTMFDYSKRLFQTVHLHHPILKRHKKIIPAS